MLRCAHPLLLPLILTCLALLLSGCSQEPATPKVVYAWWTAGEHLAAAKIVSPIHCDNVSSTYLQPNMHPDGEAVIYTGNIFGEQPHIWWRPLTAVASEMNVEGCNLDSIIRLTDLESSAIQPAYSRDGEKIVYASTKGHNQSFTAEEILTHGSPPSGVNTNIWVMNSDGSNKTQLTFGAVVDERPTFSPDGKYVVFASLDRYLNMRMGFGPGSELTQEKDEDDPYRPSTLFAVNIPQYDGEKITITSIPAAENMTHADINYRPWFGQGLDEDGSVSEQQMLYFFTVQLVPFTRNFIGGRPVVNTGSGRRWGDLTPLNMEPSDTKKIGFMEHGPSVSPDGDSLLFHAKGIGYSNRFKIYRAYLHAPDKGKTILMTPPVRNEIIPEIAHATESVNGIIAFDAKIQIPEQKPLENH